MKKIERKINFLFIDEYYIGFLNGFYKKYPKILYQDFESHKRKLIGECFGTSDFYSYNLKKLGHIANDLIVNDFLLQSKWAKDKNVEFKKPGVISKLQMMPILHRFLGRPQWIQDIVLSQIKFYKPDILYVQNLSLLNSSTLKKIKKEVKLIVGQIATSLPAKKNLRYFDLILTSFPHYVDYFRKIGINSEYFKIAFESRILKKIKKQERVDDVTFVGSFSPHHREGVSLFEKVARKVKINFWGQGTQFLSINSPIRKSHFGSVWGLDMYKVLGRSKIVINRHIKVSDGFANNMRLYESTGMGALLITDYKKNLNSLFKIGSEVVSYKNASDLSTKIKYFLSHDKEREEIAKEGQKRTLKDHTYSIRMKELLIILSKYL